MAGIDSSSTYLPSKAQISQRELLLWLFSAAVLVIVVRYFYIGNSVLFWGYLNRLNVFAAGALCDAAAEIFAAHAGRTA